VNNLNCPFCLVLKALKTNSQKEVITKASKAARSKAVVAAKCFKTLVTDLLIKRELTNLVTP